MHCEVDIYMSTYVYKWHCKKEFMGTTVMQTYLPLASLAKLSIFKTWVITVTVTTHFHFDPPPHYQGSPSHHCHHALHSAQPWAADSPGLWSWHGGPAPAHAAVSGSPAVLAAPSACPHATWLAVLSVRLCAGAAPALAPSSLPVPSLSPVCSPWTGVDIFAITEQNKTFCLSISADWNEIISNSSFCRSKQKQLQYNLLKVHDVKIKMLCAMFFFLQ